MSCQCLQLIGIGNNDFLFSTNCQGEGNGVGLYWVLTLVYSREETKGSYGGTQTVPAAYDTHRMTTRRG